MTDATIQAVHGNLHPQNLGEQAYGVEVELENVEQRPPLVVRNHWNVVDDGSLRDNGMEFVSPPIGLGTMHDSLDVLYKAKREADWTGGMRCGIHLHMDFTTKHMSHLAKFMAAYVCLEPAVMTLLCGEEREQNIYCVPYYRAPGDLARISRIVLDGDARSFHSLGRTCKYSALYLEPLLRFGTVEFRGAPVYDTVAETMLLAMFFDTLIKETATGDLLDLMNLFEEDTLAAVRRYAPDLPPPRCEELMMATDSVGLAASYFVRTRPEDREWQVPEGEARTRDPLIMAVGLQGILDDNDGPLVYDGRIGRINIRGRGQ